MDQQPVHTKGHCPLQLNHQVLPTSKQNKKVNTEKNKMAITICHEIININMNKAF